jgi:hypothetical protein
LTKNLIIFNFSELEQEQQKFFHELEQLAQDLQPLGHSGGNQHNNDNDSNESETDNDNEESSDDNEESDVDDNEPDSVAVNY